MIYLLILLINKKLDNCETKKTKDSSHKKQ